MATEKIRRPSSKSASAERTPLDRAARAGMLAGKLLLEQKRKKKKSVFGLSDGTLQVYKVSKLKVFEENLQKKITRKPSVTIATLQIKSSGKVSQRSASMVVKKLSSRK